MERDRFESALDELIAKHGRKVRAEIDAVACGTRWDWTKAHDAADAYADAREAFLQEVFAAPPWAPAPTTPSAPRENPPRAA